MAGAKTSIKKGAHPNTRVRKLDGSLVHPVSFCGKYMTGEVNGKLVCDANGHPLPYRQIGALVKE